MCAKRITFFLLLPCLSQQNFVDKPSTKAEVSVCWLFSNSKIEAGETIHFLFAVAQLENQIEETSEAQSFEATGT